MSRERPGNQTPATPEPGKADSGKADLSETELRELTVDDLRARARKEGVRATSGMRKEELVQAVTEAHRSGGSGGTSGGGGRSGTRAGATTSGGRGRSGTRARPGGTSATSAKEAGAAGDSSA